jgi:hypothetical protein
MYRPAAQIAKEFQSPARSHTTITKASPQGNHRPRQSRCRERLTTGMIQYAKQEC